MLVIGIYSLPRWIYELTRHPRPASLDSSTEVETVHPLVGIPLTNKIVRRNNTPRRSPIAARAGRPRETTRLLAALGSPSRRPLDLPGRVPRRERLPLV